MMTAKTAPKPTTIAQPIHSGNASPIANPSMTPAAKTFGIEIENRIATSNKMRKLYLPLPTIVGSYTFR